VSRRLIAVLGYSNGGDSLHDVCACRLRRAEAEARPEDVVLLSGWARRRGVTSEAELMAEAWRGAAAELELAADARTTYGNAKVAAEVAGRIGASEVVVVTSRWHERRAAALFRAALRRTGIRLALASTEGAAPRGARLRELACWTLVPPLTVYIGRRGRRGEGTLPSASS